MTGTDYTRAAADALTAAVDAEQDFPGWLAAVLAQVAARKGSSDALTAGRPGSWEASLIGQLVKGTVGQDDEYLPEPDSPDDHTRPDAAAQRAVLAAVAAQLDRDPQRAAAAVKSAPCPQCVVAACASFAVALAAQVFNAAVARATGQQPGFAVTPQLHGALSAVIEEARREIDSAGN